MSDVYKKQIGGSHYSSMVIQPSEFINKNNLPFAEGNAIKYLCRHKQKNQKELSKISEPSPPQLKLAKGTSEEVVQYAKDRHIKIIPEIEKVDLSKLPAPSDKTIDFVKDLKPVLEKSCFGCHGAKPRAKRARRDTRCTSRCARLPGRSRRS